VWLFSFDYARHAMRRLTGDYQGYDVTNLRSAGQPVHMACQGRTSGIVVGVAPRLALVQPDTERLSQHLRLGSLNNHMLARSVPFSRERTQRTSGC
jgi:hypothetical protein